MLSRIQCDSCVGAPVPAPRRLHSLHYHWTLRSHSGLGAGPRAFAVHRSHQHTVSCIKYHCNTNNLYLSKLLLHSATNITGVSLKWLRVKAGACPSLEQDADVSPGPRSVTLCDGTMRHATSRVTMAGAVGQVHVDFAPYCYLSRVTTENCNVFDKMCCRVTTETVGGRADCSVTVCCLCNIWNHQLPGLWPPVVAEELRIQITSLTGNIEFW